jgi:hypothetical protein
MHFLSVVRSCSCISKIQTRIHVQSDLEGYTSQVDRLLLNWPYLLGIIIDRSELVWVQCKNTDLILFLSETEVHKVKSRCQIVFLSMNKFLGWNRNPEYLLFPCIFLEWILQEGSLKRWQHMESLFWSRGLKLKQYGHHHKRVTVYTP